MNIGSIAMAAAALDILREEQADNRRLREALTDIRNRILCPVGPSPSLAEVEAIASAALEPRSVGGIPATPDLRPRRTGG